MSSNENLSFNNEKELLCSKLLREVDDHRVVRTMMEIPRERFVNSNMQEKSYHDVALPIGYGQTISQPLMVAIMVSAMMIKRSDNVLEIGTGSGYQTAILSKLAKKVSSVERIPQLLSQASNKLEGLKCNNVNLSIAEEELGCPKRGPYDAIVVAAGSPKLPEALLQQLKDGGRLVIPVGSHDSQELMRIIRKVSDYSIHVLTSCRFVPLIGKDAWSVHDLPI